MNKNELTCTIPSITVVNCNVNNTRASVFPFQNCVNSVSGFANSVFYRFRFYKFRFLPFQIFRIPFHIFKALFLVSMIFC